MGRKNSVKDTEIDLLGLSTEIKMRLFPMETRDLAEASEILRSAGLGRDKYAIWLHSYIKAWPIERLEGFSISLSAYLYICTYLDIAQLFDVMIDEKADYKVMNDILQRVPEVNRGKAWNYLKTLIDDRKKILIASH